MKILKRIVLTALLAAFSFAAWAENIQNYHSGLWYDSEHPGHGLSIEVLAADRMVAYWYAYHPDGTPMWLEILADIDGDTATGEAYHYSGVRFGDFDPFDIVETPWGTVSITFEGCNTAQLSYESPLSQGEVPFGTGEIDLVRLTSIEGLECPVALEDGKFGNFSSGLEFDPYGASSIESFVWIQRDGTLAYQAAHEGVMRERGYGQIVMTDENTFRFEAVTSTCFDCSSTQFSSREGSGEFAKDSLGRSQVTLYLGEQGSLRESLDSSFQDGVTYGDLAGEYSCPDAMCRLTVDDTGAFTGVAFGEFWGTLTIPSPGFNQLTMEWRQPGLVNRCIGMQDRNYGHLRFICQREDIIFDMVLFRGSF